jgi:AcrR family transcriptional regulator
MSDDVRHSILKDLFSEDLSKAQRTKLRIMEAAIRSYASVGLEKSTFDRIAKLCKTSRPLVQHYFNDREELTLWVIKYIRARFQKYCIDCFLKETQVERQIEVYVRSVFDWCKDYPMDARVWLHFYYLCSFKPDYRALNTELVTLGQKRIAGLIQLGVDQGLFRAGDIPKRAKLLQNAITGGFILLMTEQPSEALGRDAIDAVTNHCLELARGAL